MSTLWRYTGLSLAALCGLWPVQGFSQAIETVVVSASPPDPVGNAAFSVVNLDAGALQRSPQLDMALEQVPGLSLFRRNSSLSANPTTEGVSLRSIAPSGAGRALVTLDGVPQNDPFGGWVIWSSLPAEALSGAEIVRGAGAGPYGAGALTGVIALQEAAGDGLAAADVSGGALGQRRAAAAGGASWGKISVFASASVEASDGWIPLAPDQRGAADDAVTLDARNAAVRFEASPAADTVVVARFGVYDERRQSGIVGTVSDASGFTASLTAAHPESQGALGWRMQLWLRDTGFSNSSASVSADRSTATPADDQYATPALGWGANAALRGEAWNIHWEAGVDARLASGESREHYAYSNGAFADGRMAGGDSFVGGLYAEGAWRTEGWLVTLGVRADQWTSTGGHLIQTNLATGAVTLDQHYAARSGLVPTARAGIRRDFADGFYLRTAAYEGFRAPSLNELYRPYRVGNDMTQANAALTPEQLYGAEVGAGWSRGAFASDITLFWNQLHGAITNVTLGPDGLPGGTLMQRQNLGDIDAPGVEGEAHYDFDRVRLRAAFDMADAHVHGGTAAPQLTGKRPQQAPRWTVTGGFDARLFPRLTVSADLRYESGRFADDQNTLLLPAATTVDARISWRATGHVSVFVAAQNLLNARIATTESSDGIIDYDAPRILGVGLSYSDGDGN